MIRISGIDYCILLFLVPYPPLVFFTHLPAAFLDDQQGRADCVFFAGRRR